MRPKFFSDSKYQFLSSFLIYLVDNKQKSYKNICDKKIIKQVDERPVLCIGKLKF